MSDMGEAKADGLLILQFVKAVREGNNETSANIANALGVEKLLAGLARMMDTVGSANDKDWLEKAIRTLGEDDGL